MFDASAISRAVLYVSRGSAGEASVSNTIDLSATFLAVSYVKVDCRASEVGCFAQKRKYTHVSAEHSEARQALRCTLSVRAMFENTRR